MQRTLFTIPHEIGGLPVFGFGWMLILAAVALLVRLAWGRSRGQKLGEILAAEGIVWLVIGLLVVYVARFVELRNIDGEPIGMAIRGYGVMLLSGVAAGVALAYYRAKRVGIDPDIILSMAPWAFIGGIIGARLFFVIQYREDFIGATLGETLGNMFRFTEGGLVVYGSFIGGFLAVTYYLIRHRLPWLKIGDIVVPAIFIGVFFGRIGCLMNGCCYGGRCEDDWYALHFPPTSPVYQDQLRTGELLGFRFDPDTRTIQSVEPGSLADEAGITSGSRLDLLDNDRSPLPEKAKQQAVENVRRGVIATVDGKRYRWTVDDLPNRALPVVGVQLLSSVSSLVLCLLLCVIPMNKFRPGTILMIGFASYALLRFGLEWVRVDEEGQFGTPFSISQLVSMVVLACTGFGLWWIYRTPSDPVPAAAVAEKN